MKNYINSFLYVGVCFLSGYAFIQAVVQKNVSLRDPAATTGTVYQIHELSSDQIKAQLVKKMKVTPTLNGQKTILFPGFSSAVCEKFSSIELEFASEGVSVAGDPTLMKVVAPCEKAKDPSEIKEMTLPVAKILKEKPRSADFNFADLKTTISFKNAADEWPLVWVLKKVEFKAVTGSVKTAEFNRTPASVGTAEAERLIVLEF